MKVNLIFEFGIISLLIYSIPGPGKLLTHPSLELVNSIPGPGKLLTHPSLELTNSIPGPGKLLTHPSLELTNSNLNTNTRNQN